MKFILTAITAGSLFSALGQVPLPSYTVYDIGALGTGTTSYGFGINNAGWVAGSSNLVPNGPLHSFLWYGSHTLKDLGTLGGASCPTCNSGAEGPNASGEAAIGPIPRHWIHLARTFARSAVIGNA